MCPVMPQYVKAVIFSYEHGLHFRSCPTTLKLSYSAIHMVYVSGYAPLHENCHLQLYTVNVSGHAAIRESCHIQLCTWFTFPVMPNYGKAVIFSYTHSSRYRLCFIVLSSSAVCLVYDSGYARLCESCHLQLCTWFTFPVMPHCVNAVIFSYAHGLRFRSCPTT